MPPLRSAHRSLLTIPPHGHQSRRAHLFSPQRFGQLIAPFPVPRLGSCLHILLRQQPKPSSLPKSPVSSFLPSPTLGISAQIYGLSLPNVPRRNPLTCPSFGDSARLSTE